MRLNEVMMRKNKLLSSILICLWSLLLIIPGLSQNPNQTPTNADDQQKAQAALEQKALKLLDQIISQGQGLKLPENRIRVQFSSADMLWSHDEARARNLF